MKLLHLLTSLPRNKVFGKTLVEVKGVSEDSRQVSKGYLFVAVPGLMVDGHGFINKAIGKGAKTIVGEKDYQDLNIPKGITYVKVKNSRKYFGILASRFYGNPSKKLKVIGVTGTKGKTTTCHLIYHILTNTGNKSGLVSSIEAKIGNKSYDTGLHVTSPDPITLNKFLSKMVDEDCKYAVIEVSSHGIDQKRIAGINFEAGVLTNIAPEHLDYHKTFENYKETKLSFIKSAKYQVIAPKATKLNILTGEFNNLNVEAAIEAVKYCGVDRDRAIKTLRTFRLPEGRMMKVKNDNGVEIIIDFAHTPSSLEAVLKHLKKQKTKNQKLIAIFGCASERDDSKRPVMGEISAKLADISIFTAEDPRKENVEKIISEMFLGALKVKNVSEVNTINYHTTVYGSYEKKHYILRIPERGEAISFAIQKIAKKGDIIAILGKGHERSMAYNGVEYPWSDKKAVEYALKEKVLTIQRT